MTLKELQGSALHFFLETQFQFKNSNLQIIRKELTVFC